MIKRLILSCKKATYLISLKEERKLSLKQRWQLRAHLSLCSMCRLFEIQTRFIARNAKNNHPHDNQALNEESKEKMREKLKSFMDK